jgi:hypothetical protein
MIPHLTFGPDDFTAGVAGASADLSSTPPIMVNKVAMEPPRMKSRRLTSGVVGN